MSDQLPNGRRFRIFNLIDDFSRQCVGQIVDTSISGARLARFLDELGASRSLPKTLVLDNGPEFTCKAMFFWAQRTGVRLHFIQPGKPTQNAFIESFNGKLREYCLDLHWFASQPDARATIDLWAKSHPRGLRRRWPDMLFLPHQAWLGSAGTVNIVLDLIGLGGIQDDMTTWTKWLE